MLQVLQVHQGHKVLLALQVQLEQLVLMVYQERRAQLEQREVEEWQDLLVQPEPLEQPDPLDQLV